MTSEGTSRRPLWRVAAQAAVSVVLLVVLVRFACRDDLGTAFHTVTAWPLLAAAGLYALAAVLSALRWQVLLRQVGINETLPRLSASYFVGLFFSLFLPTSSGGDAVRIYEVARPARSALRVVLATLQERLTGLGMTLAVGLTATLLFWGLLPSSLRWGIVAVQCAGIAGVVALLYPRPFLYLLRRVWRSRLIPARVRGLAARPLGTRLSAGLRRLSEAPPPARSTVGLVLLLAFVSFALQVLMHDVLGRALGVRVGPLAYCLVVPLVWVVRNLPVSLNGIGVGDGAFVLLIGLFAVAPERGLALSLTVLAVQSVVALVGGVILLVRLVRAASGEVPTAIEQEEPGRHAA